MSKPYWFRAKTIGIGWGLPCAWQGWVVLAAYFLGVACVLDLGPGRLSPTLWQLATLALTCVLLGFYAWKGEPLS